MLRKERWKGCYILIAIVLLFAISALAQVPKLEKKKVKVTDGDTISITEKDGTKTKVRFIGIDAPEKKQDFGRTCTDKLRKFLKGDVMEIERHGTDRYGRILGRVIVDDKDVNLEMLQIGCAWIYEFAWKVPKEYHEAFQTARNNKIGLFKNENAEHPSDYRKKRKKPG